MMAGNESINTGEPRDLKEYLAGLGPLKNNLLVHIIPVEFKPRMSISDAISYKITDPKKIGESVIAIEFDNGSVVYVMIDRDLGEKEGIDIVKHKKCIHDIFKYGVTNKITYDGMTNACKSFKEIEKDIKRRCMKKTRSPEREDRVEKDIKRRCMKKDWKEITGGLYVFSMYFTNRKLDDKEKSYLLDSDLIFYSDNEYKSANYERVKDDRRRISNLTFDDMPFSEDAELRSEYYSWFSWSLVLVMGKYTDEVCAEYIEMEIVLQMKWNAAYRYYKSIEANSFYTRLSNLRSNRSLEKLDDFEMRLNSLDDSGESDRTLNLRGKLVESSKIKILIDQSRTKLEKRRDGVAITFSIIALGVALAGAVIAYFK